MAGEVQHDKGAEGLRRARKWLSMTTRVDQIWTHEDTALASLLEFSWPHGSTNFSFDIGGVFRGGELNGQAFVGEVKNYKSEQDLPKHYRAFLAKCYVAYLNDAEKCGHFLWISWAPFQAQKWDQHATTDAVINAVAHTDHLERVFGAGAAPDEIDREVASKVADCVWLVTLSDNQELLYLQADHYSYIQGQLALEAIGNV